MGDAHNLRGLLSHAARLPACGNREETSGSRELAALFAGGWNPRTRDDADICCSRHDVLEHSDCGVATWIRRHRGPDGVGRPVATRVDLAPHSLRDLVARDWDRARPRSR